MALSIQINPAEQIRRAKAANPSISDDDLKARFGVNASQIKAALAYKGLQKNGRRRA